MTKEKSPTYKALSKTEIYKAIAEATGLQKSQVVAVLDALLDEVKKSLSEGWNRRVRHPRPGQIEKRTVPAKPARTGVPKPVQAGRIDGRGGQASQHQNQGSGPQNLKAMA